MKVYVLTETTIPMMLGGAAHKSFKVVGVFATLEEARRAVHPAFRWLGTMAVSASIGASVSYDLHECDLADVKPAESEDA